MTKQNNIRFCIITKTHYPKSKLFRFVLTADHKVILDLNYNLPGRGVYVYRSLAAITTLETKKILERKFKTKIDPSFYHQLHSYLLN